MKINCPPQFIFFLIIILAIFLYIIYHTYHRVNRGGYCQISGDCQKGLVCYENTCVIDPQSNITVFPGENCFAPTECPQGTFCSATGSCLAKPPAEIGEACKFDQDCNFGLHCNCEQVCSRGPISYFVEEDTVRFYNFIDEERYAMGSVIYTSLEGENKTISAFIEKGEINNDKVLEYLTGKDLESVNETDEFSKEFSKESFNKISNNFPDKSLSKKSPLPYPPDNIITFNTEPFTPLNNFIYNPGVKIISRAPSDKTCKLPNFLVISNEGIITDLSNEYSSNQFLIRYRDLSDDTTAFTELELAEVCLVDQFGNIGKEVVNENNQHYITFCDSENYGENPVCSGELETLYLSPEFVEVENKKKKKKC